MQIHEITQAQLKEGILGDLGRGLATGLTGFDIPQGQSSINRQAAQSAEKLRAQGYKDYAVPGTIERITVSVKQADNPLPSKYVKTGTTWTNETGAVITNAKSKAYLDSLIPTHGKKEIVSVDTTPLAPARKISRQRGSRGRMVKTK
jgi:hypothetical protein